MPLRLAIFVEGTFLPSREGATRRFSGLARHMARAGAQVTVVHCFRGWSDMGLIAEQPFTTYFVPPTRFYNDINALVGILDREDSNVAVISDFETVLKLGVPLKLRRPSLRIAFEAHDVVTDFRRSLGENDEAVTKTSRSERLAFHAVDRLISFTARDVNSIRGMLNDWKPTVGSSDAVTRSEVDDINRRLKWLPFGCEVENFSGASYSSVADAVIFVGNLYHRPNALAVDFLASEVLPRLLELGPPATFLVVGDAPEQMRSRYTNAHFQFLGSVDHLEPVFRNVGLALSPVFQGSGIKVKVLDYCAGGLPILCSRQSTEGVALNAAHLNAFALEDNPAAYPFRIRQLLNHRSERARLSCAARQVAACHDWQEITPVTFGLYDQLSQDVPKPIPPAIRELTDMPTPYYLTDYIGQRRFASTELPELSKMMRGGRGLLETVGW